MDTPVDIPAVALRHPVAQRTAYAALRSRLARQALCWVDAAVAIVDVGSPDQPLAFVNGAFCRLTGYDETELLGRSCRLLQHPDVDPVTLALMRCGIAARQPAEALFDDGFVGFALPALSRHGVAAPASIDACPAFTFGAPIAPPAPDKALLPCLQ